MSVYRKSQGFTLIELLIVVAIVSILAGIAYASYTSQVRKSAQTEVKGALTTAAAMMERRKATSLSYLGATVGNAASDTVSDRSPASGAIKYNISMPTLSATTFVIKATSATALGVDEALMINQLGQTCINAGSTADCAFGTDPAW